MQPRCRVHAFVILLTCLIAPAQADTLALPNNLAEESCDAVSRDDITPEPGVPAELKLRCDERVVGSVLFSRFFARDKNPAALQAALMQQYRGSRAEKRLAQRMTCKAGKPVEEGSALVALPCTLLNGGWPHLVVIGGEAGSMVVAEGPPALWPVLHQVVTGSPIAATKPQQIDTLKKIWGGPVVLASADDIARFKDLLREGRSANSLRKFRESEMLIREALAIQTRLLGEHDVSIADTLMDLALNVSNQGRSDEAAALFRRAEPIIQRSPNEADRARLAGYLGLEAANRGDFAVARQYARSAVERWRKINQQGGVNAILNEGSEADAQERGELAMALNFEARMSLRADDVVSASAAATEALMIVNQNSDLPKWWKSDVLMTLGEVSIAQRRLSAAETYFNSALTERRQIFGEGFATMGVFTALGRAYQIEGMNTSAIISYREAFKIARSLPSTQDLFTIEELMPFAAAVTAWAQNVQDDNERQGLYTEAFDAFMMLRSPLIEKTISQAASRLMASDPDIAERVTKWRAAERAGDVASIELAQEQALPDEQRSAKVESQLEQKIRDARSLATSLKKELEERHPAYLEMASPKPLDLMEMRKRLGDREGLVSFMIGRDGAYVQLIKRKGIYIARVPETRDTLQDTVAALRRALDVQGGAVNEFDLARAHQLYRSLFDGIAPHMAGLEHLIVVPSGPLASLPFGLLVTAQPEGKDYSRAQWLTQRIALSHTPSLQSFFSLRAARAVSVAPKPLLAFGDPALEGARGEQRSASLAKANQTCRQVGPMNVETLLALAPLPETAQEIKKVAALMKADNAGIFLGREATESSLRRQALDQYRVIYFATHGLLPGELQCQAEPGLVLTPLPFQASQHEHDGLLDASEIAALKLNADLVVLSACNTAGGGKFGGESLSGLAEAFFHAGSRSMVVSHWQVPSAATAKLMTGMFEFLGPQLSTGSAPALRDAQIKAIAEPATAHPFFWAAFVVLGDGLFAASP
ncbi:MAG: hypothetical protein RIR70_1897 [Pseudomonadota bacterium]